MGFAVYTNPIWVIRSSCLQKLKVTWAGIESRLMFHFRSKERGGGGVGARQKSQLISSILQRSKALTYFTSVPRKCGSLHTSERERCSTACSPSTSQMEWVDLWLSDRGCSQSAVCDMDLWSLWEFQWGNSMDSSVSMFINTQTCRPLLLVWFSSPHTLYWV